MTIDNLVLYVKNTGEMYKGNCALAQTNVSFDTWYRQAHNGLLRYRRECREPNEGMSEADLQEAARQLKAYYEAHVKEL